MTTWNSGPYPPPQDPNQGYYGGQPGGYPQQPYPGAGYPPPGGYPPQGGGYPPQGGYPPSAPQGYPPQGPGVPGYGQPDPYQPDNMYGSNYGQDPEAKGFDFSDQTIRRGFIKKVYSILMVQLAITFGFVALVVKHRPTQHFVSSHPELFILSIVVLFISMIALACCGELRRKAPINFILLGLFTFAEAFMLGMTSAHYKSEEVMLAVGITAAVCLALTLFAFQTKYDFTMCGGILLVAVIILLIFGIVAMFFPGKTITLVYASLGALLFSIYLIYDTQLMMGGKHKYSISPEEYIFAALNLYVDIINIFIYILTIIGASRD